MSAMFDELSSKAMSLSPLERARLADLMVESLDAAPLTEVDQAWITLAQRRALEVREGIVFNTAKLWEMLEEETKRFHYQFGVWGDVEYYDRGDAWVPSHPETLESETKLHDAVFQFVLSGNPDDLEPILESITQLSCLHKHWGISRRSGSEDRCFALE